MTTPAPRPVKRYEVTYEDETTIFNGMGEAEDGDWIVYDDYAALAAKVERLDFLLREAINAHETGWFSVKHRRDWLARAEAEKGKT